MTPAVSHAAISPVSDSESARRTAYSSAFAGFRSSLAPADRRRINGSGSPDWQGSRTFALPVNADHPAYTSEPGDPVIETLEELAAIEGSMAKIALWVNDRAGGLDALRSIEQFRIAIARICSAKMPRLEALLVSLAIRMNFRGNANGFEIALHFGLTPQTCHEMLAETCRALGLPKPLSKINKARYAQTQFRHKPKKKSIT